jgi:X-Pro dipeptidyl-peptidase (S15 family)
VAPVRSRTAVATVLATAIAALASGAAAASAAPVPANADWTEAYITEADGARLHADVLRPKNLPSTEKTPVILSNGSYVNHSGETGPARPVEGTTFDPTRPRRPVRPVPRLRQRRAPDGSRLHVRHRGPARVRRQVRLPGLGRPGRAGRRETAVQWGASQPWSTGKVGMYGKFYDGVTGLVGAVEQPPGLAAVVSREPVYDLYRYLYSNGVRFVNSLATPALYDMIAETPGTVQDDPSYNLNGASQSPDWPITNELNQATNSDHDSAFWAQRDLIAKVHSWTVPLFLTQGFLEDNTKPDGAFHFFNEMAGPKRGVRHVGSRPRQRHGRERAPAHGPRRAAAQREPRRRRLRHRQRHQLQRVADRDNRPNEPRPLRRRLEDRPGPSHRRARHRRERGVVGARADAPNGDGPGRQHQPAVPRPGAPRPDPGRPIGQARELRADAPFAVPAATIATGTSPGFGIPPQQTPAP